MTTQAFISELRKLIAEDKLEVVLKRLQAFLENSPLLNDVIMQASRLQSVRQQVRLGIVDYRDSTLTKNQITAGLLDLLDEVALQENNPLIRQEMAAAVSIINSKNVVQGSTISAGGNVNIGDTITTHSESKSSQRLKIFLYAFVPILAIVLAVVYFQYERQQIPLTVKVNIDHKTPNPELGSPSGKLTFSYGQQTDVKENVSESAIFESIPANVAGESVQFTYVAKGFREIDTSLTLKADAIITLPVFRNNDLASLQGVINDDMGNPLAGVSVSLDCCSATTDAAGRFKLSIPFRSQRKSQRIDLFKAGYAPKSTTTPVFPGETFRDFLLKN